MKVVEGTRLDYTVPSHNCAVCEHKIGNVCDYHHAILQTNPHRPTDCNEWSPKKERRGL